MADLDDICWICGKPYPERNPYMDGPYHPDCDGEFLTEKQLQLAVARLAAQEQRVKGEIRSGEVVLQSDMGRFAFPIQQIGHVIRLLYDLADAYNAQPPAARWPYATDLPATIPTLSKRRKAPAPAAQGALFDGVTAERPRLQVVKE